MILQRQVDYAARLILDLADRPNGSLVKTRDVADRQQIPRMYLAKTVQLLSRAGLVRPVRGAGGGVALARSPKEITLLDVVEAVQGPYTFTGCIVRPRDCPVVSYCPFHSFWEKYQKRVVKALKSTNFQRLVRLSKNGRTPIAV